MTRSSSSKLSMHCLGFAGDEVDGCEMEMDWGGRVGSDCFFGGWWRNVTDWVVGSVAGWCVGWAYCRVLEEEQMLDGMRVGYLFPVN